MDNIYGWLLEYERGWCQNNSKRPREPLSRELHKFEFKTNNNQAENEVLITDMNLSIYIETSTLRASSDSWLITNQVIKEYQSKEDQLIKYFINVRDLYIRFKFFEYVTSEKNSRGYLILKLARTKKLDHN